MSRVFWDTNIYIYLLEESPSFVARVVRLRQSMTERGDQLVTSTFTLGEILVKPMLEGNERLVDWYRKSFPETSLLIPFGEEAAAAYARLRCDRSLKHPDAIQLACAGSYGVDFFVTNDARLQSKRVPASNSSSPWIAFPSKRNG